MDGDLTIHYSYRRIPDRNQHFFSRDRRMSWVPKRRRRKEGGEEPAAEKPIKRFSTVSSERLVVFKKSPVRTEKPSPSPKKSLPTRLAFTLNSSCISIVYSIWVPRGPDFSTRMSGRRVTENWHPRNTFPTCCWATRIVHLLFWVRPTLTSFLLLGVTLSFCGEKNKKNANRPWRARIYCRKFVNGWLRSKVLVDIVFF